jgi:hypothetical protein
MKTQKKIITIGLAAEAGLSEIILWQNETLNEKKNRLLRHYYPSANED